MEDEVRPLMLTERHDLINPVIPIVVPWDPSRAKKSGILILVAVALERFAYWSVIMNLFLYLSKVKSEGQAWEPFQALTAVFIINGISCVCAPVGGWLSDSLIGRYWVIVGGMVIYIFGYCLLTALSMNGLNSLGCEWHSNDGNDWNIFEMKSRHCLPHIYTILILIGCGEGVVKANIPPFGAEQVRASGEFAVRQFFNAYYWCVNCGSLLGVGIFAYVQQNIDNGFCISYIATTIALCISLVVFCCGRRIYLVHSPRNAVVMNIFRIIGEGLYTNCRNQESIQGSPMFRRELESPHATPIALSPSWIDRAKISYGGSFHDATVDDVKSLGITIVFISMLLPFWLVYFQMSTSFQAQGLHMNIHLNETMGPNFEIPVAWLTLCDEVFVLVLIPLLNFLIFPWLDRKNVRTSPFCRMMVGMFTAIAAILTAAIVERARLRQLEEGKSVTQIISGTNFTASALSILFQIPQYCLIGTAEVFAGVAGMEYAYTTAPRTFQGIIMGLYSAIEGLGSFLGIALVQLTRCLHLGWIDGDVNKGHLDYFYYLLATIQSLFVVIFGLVIYLRWKPPRQENVDETLTGVSACEYYLTSNAATPSNPESVPLVL